MNTSQTLEVIEHFFKELEHPAKPLNTWENNFLISIKDQFDNRGTLSPKQFEILERIYAEKTA
jgi:hypothetical protein